MGPILPQVGALPLATFWLLYPDTRCHWFEYVLLALRHLRRGAGRAGQARAGTAAWPWWRRDVLPYRGRPRPRWEQIAPHAMHETNDYAEWAKGMRGSPYTSFDSADELRKSGMYEIVTPDDAVDLIRERGGVAFKPLDGWPRPRHRLGVAAPVRIEGLATLTRVERSMTDGVRWMFHATAMGPSYDAIFDPLARLFGCRVLHDNEVSTPGVERRGGMTWIADNSIEIGQPLGESSPVRRFLERFGGGMHSVAVQVADLDVALEPRSGAGCGWRRASTRGSRSHGRVTRPACCSSGTASVRATTPAGAHPSRPLSASRSCGPPRSRSSARSSTIPSAPRWHFGEVLDTDVSILAVDGPADSPRAASRSATACSRCIRSRRRHWRASTCGVPSTTERGVSPSDSSWPTSRQASGVGDAGRPRAPPSQRRLGRPRPERPPVPRSPHRAPPPRRPPRLKDKLASVHQVCSWSC